MLLCKRAGTGTVLRKGVSTVSDRHPATSTSAPCVTQTHPLPRALRRRGPPAVAHLRLAVVRLGRCLGRRADRLDRDRYRGGFPAARLRTVRHAPRDARSGRSDGEARRDGGLPIRAQSDVPRAAHHHPRPVAAIRQLVAGAPRRVRPSRGRRVREGYEEPTLTRTYRGQYPDYSVPISAATCGDGFRASRLRRPGLCRPGAPRPSGPRSSPSGTPRLPARR